MTVIFLDPGIVSFSGHHTNTVWALKNAVRERGWPVRVMGHRSLTPEVAAALGAEPLFSLGTYAVTSTDPVCWPLETLIDGSSVIAADLSRLQPAPGDILVWPTARPHHIVATGMALRSWPSPLFTVFAAGLPCVQPESQYWRFACRRLPPEAPVILNATAQMMADDYAQAVGRPFQTAPFYHEGRARDRSGADPVVVGLLGHQRRSKGIHRVPDIIRRTQAGNVRWLVQDSGTDAEPILSELERLPGVQVLRGPMADWPALLDRCDALLLPYDRDEYDRMHSGLVGEGMACGMPLIIPDTPGLLSQSAGGGRVVYKGDSPDVVAAAVDALAGRFRELADAAYGGAGRYAARNGPGRWADWLLAEAGAAGFRA